MTDQEAAGPSSLKAKAPLAKATTLTQSSNAAPTASTSRSGSASILPSAPSTTVAGIKSSKSAQSAKTQLTNVKRYLEKLCSSIADLADEDLPFDVEDVSKIAEPLGVLLDAANRKARAVSGASSDSRDRLMD